MSVLWLVLLTGFLAVLQALLCAGFNFKNLSYDRRFSKTRAYEGQKVELLESIRNRKLLPVPWLRAESRIPQELGFRRRSRRPRSRPRRAR